MTNEYYENNKDKIREYQRRYQKKNRKIINEKLKKKNRENTIEFHKFVQEHPEMYEEIRKELEDEIWEREIKKLGEKK